MKTASKASNPESANWAGPLYLDASALVKIYLPEPGSDELNAILEDRDDLMMSDLAVTEIISALARRRREGLLSSTVVARLRRAILADVEMGYFHRVDLIPAVHREAERLLLTIESIPLRAADSLHLALASAARAASVVTFDKRLAEAALRAGLSAVP